MKIQSGDPGRNALDGDGQSDNIDEQDLLHQIEGFDWDDDRRRMETDQYLMKLENSYSSPSHDMIWCLPDEKQLMELMTRLALCRIRAYEGEELKGLEENQLTDPVTLEEQGYYEWCEREFEWYFDLQSFNNVGQDYQWLVLRNNGEYDYDDWESYFKHRSTPQADQQYVHFWDKLSFETKWLEKGFQFGRQVREKLECVAFYRAVKIATDFPKIDATLILSGFNEYIWSVEYDDNIYYQGYTWLYFEIWKRVAKQKMDLKVALEQVSAGDMPTVCSAVIELELNNILSDIPGPVTHNYETYVTEISGELEECHARPLILEAVKKMLPKCKTRYDYAKKKLDIARRIGLVTQ